MAIYDLEDVEKEMVELVVGIFKNIADGVDVNDIIPVVTDLTKLIQTAYSDMSEETKKERIATIVKVLTAAGLEIALGE